MTEQNIRTRVKLKPVLFVAAGVVVLLGLLWLTGFFGGAFNALFTSRTDFSHSRGLRDEVDQGTDALLSQADVPVSGSPEVLVTDPMVGPASAQLRAVIFGSLTSGYTAGAYDVINAMRSDYPNTVQIVWKDLFSRDDQQARELAIAARCADRQGKFWEYVGGVFNQAGGLPEVVVDVIAAEIGLDIDVFHACQSDAEIAQQIDHNLTEASRLKARGVPLLFIGSETIDGLFPYSWIKPVIDEQLR